MNEVFLNLLDMHQSHPIKNRTIEEIHYFNVILQKSILFAFMIISWFCKEKNPLTELLQNFKSKTGVAN